ncbi:phage holin family protein [Novipirellula caenicola]|uniref:Phage holin family protein n=1 Tax=Novipirellula caenicola TaxID=1536901 RepID=A0ABP9VKX1_9BACT
MTEQSRDHQSSFQRVTEDVLDLFELQMQLLSVDSQAAKRKLSQAVACGAVAIALAGSALTVLMVGGGFLLSEFTELTAGQSLLIVGVVFFLIVALLGWIALKAVGAAAAAMSESKSEFAENLRWLKATLVSPKTSPRNQIRRDSFSDEDSDLRRQSAWSGSTHDSGQRPPVYPR